MINFLGIGKIQLKALSLILSMSACQLVFCEEMGSLRMPKEIKQGQLEDKAGAKIPDVQVTNQDGETFSIKKYFDGSDKRPVVMTLGYYGCPMLCTLVLNGMLEALEKVSYKVGDDYRIISLSIDHRETPDLAKNKQKNYLKALGISDKNSDYWQFHVMSEEDAKKISDAIGFNYFYDKKSDQYAHGAGFFTISPSGVLSRTLFGIKFKPSDVKLALSDAADGKIGSFVDQLILSCFHYDPDSHKYGVYIMGVMRLGAGLTVLILGFVLMVYFRLERKRTQRLR